MSSSKGSRTRRPAGNRSGNRGPGRTGTGTASGAGPTAADPATGQLQASVLGTWAANQPQVQVDQGPWAAVPQMDLQEEGPEPGEGGGFDPDLAFGLPLEDPLPQEATIGDPDGAASDSEAPTKRGAFTAWSRGAVDPLKAKGRSKVFGTLAAAAFAAASGVLNERLALDDADETWLADDEEVDAVADPAGRIIARHVPLPAGAEAQDLADAIDLVIVTGAYLAKNVMARLRLRREQRRGPQVPVYEG